MLQPRRATKTAPDLSIGQPVKPRVSLADDIGIPVPTPTTKVVETSRKELRWFKGKPQVLGHFSETQYQAHRKFGPRTWVSFDLLNPDDLAKLNELEVKAHDEDGKGPAIVMIKSHQVVKDRWICLVEFQDIFYQELIPAAVLAPQDHEPIESTPAKTRRTQPSTARKAAGGVAKPRRIRRPDGRPAASAPDNS